MKMPLLPAVQLLFLLGWGITSRAQSPTVETAFIVSVNASPDGVHLFRITADYVQLLTGKAAIAAARAVGEAEFTVGKKRDTVWLVPNDYFVQNRSTKTHIMNVAPKAKVFLVAEGSSKIAPSTISRLQQSFAGKLFQLTISNSAVEKIEEIYTP